MSENYSTESRRFALKWENASLKKKTNCEWKLEKKQNWKENKPQTGWKKPFLVTSAGL